MRLPAMLVLLGIFLPLPLSAVGDRGSSASPPALAVVDDLLRDGRWMEARAVLFEAVRSEQYHEAAPYLSKFVEVRPYDAEAQAMLGFCFLKRFDYHKAEAQFRAALKLSPGKVPWQVGLARSLHQQGRYLAALELLDLAVAENPRPEYRYARATAAWNARKLETMEKEIQALRREYPADGEADCWLGRLLLETQQAEPSLTALEACLQRQPANIEALYSLGHAQLSLGNLAAAADRFREVLTLRPNHAGARYNLGRTLLRLGETEAGRSTLKSFASQSAHEDEIGRLQNAVRMGPTKWSARVQLARALLESGRWEEARTQAEAAARLAPGNPDVAELLAQVEARSSGSARTEQALDTQ